MKGTPSERPGAEQAAAEQAATAPPAVERPSQPQTVVITESEEPELASWLLQDLKPRSSLPPEALSTTLLASKWESVSPGSVSPASVSPASVSSDSLAPAAPLAPVESLVPPPDSLVPHAVSEAPAALALRDATLDAEDLAVLPSRRGKKRDWRKVVVLAALLSVAGAVLWVASGPQVEDISTAAASAAPAMLTAPLPPPPPSDDVLAPVVEPVPSAPATTSAKPGGGAASSEPALDDEPGFAGRRAGDAVARFADLPSPTLSRLAREEQQRLRKAASARAAGKTPAANSPAANSPAAKPFAAKPEP